jgi:hypothetical protein
MDADDEHVNPKLLSAAKLLGKLCEVFYEYGSSTSAQAAGDKAASP